MKMKWIDFYWRFAVSIVFAHLIVIYVNAEMMGENKNPHVFIASALFVAAIFWGRLKLYDQSVFFYDVDRKAIEGLAPELVFFGNVIEDVAPKRDERSMLSAHATNNSKRLLIMVLSVAGSAGVGYLWGRLGYFATLSYVTLPILTGAIGYAIFASQMMFSLLVTTVFGVLVFFSSPPPDVVPRTEFFPFLAFAFIAAIFFAIYYYRQMVSFRLNEKLQADETRIVRGAITACVLFSILYIGWNRLLPKENPFKSKANRRSQTEQVVGDRPSGGGSPLVGDGGSLKPGSFSRDVAEILVEKFPNLAKHTNIPGGGAGPRGGAPGVGAPGGDGRPGDGGASPGGARGGIPSGGGTLPQDGNGRGGSAPEGGAPGGGGGGGPGAGGASPSGGRGDMPEASDRASSEGLSPQNPKVPTEEEIARAKELAKTFDPGRPGFSHPGGSPRGNTVSDKVSNDVSDKASGEATKANGKSAWNDLDSLKGLKKSDANTKQISPGVGDSRGEQSGETAPGGKSHERSPPADRAAGTAKAKQTTPSISKPNIEPLVAKIEVVMAIVKAVGFLALIGVVLFYLSKILSSAKKDEKKPLKTYSLTSEQLLKFKTIFDQIRRKGLGAEQEVIESYNAVLLLFESTHFPRADWLPTQEYSIQVGTELPKLGIQFQSATMIFGRTLYGEKAVDVATLEQFRGDVGQVLKFFGLK